MALEGLRVKTSEPCDDFDEFCLSPIFPFHFIYVMNINIRDGHLKNLVHAEIIVLREESPYKPGLQMNSRPNSVSNGKSKFL